MIFFTTYSTRIILVIGQLQGVYTLFKTKIIKAFKKSFASYEQIF
jgi:hypothetical protein